MVKNESAVKPNKPKRCDENSEKENLRESYIDTSYQNSLYDIRRSS